MLHFNRRFVLYILLLLIGLFTVNAAVRGFAHAKRLRQHPDEPIQPWMNIPYIAHSYHVPPAVVAGALGIDDRQRDPRPLKKIAAERGVSVTALADQIMAAITEFRASPPGPPDVPAPPPPPAVPSPAASGSST